MNKQVINLIELNVFPAETPWQVVVYTGDVRGAGTNANVFLVLYGESGKSDEFRLRDKSDNFERAQVDKFKVSNPVFSLLLKIENPWYPPVSIVR